MTREELVAEYMRVIEQDGRTVLQVGLVKWDEAHAPARQWTTHRSWSRPPTPARLRAAQERLLATRRYFRTCRRCGKLRNAGHMFDADTCQGCAERYAQVVY